MSTITIVGAGGKMGARLTANLSRTAHHLLVVEPAEAARSALSAQGLPPLPLGEAVGDADVVILAVPDNRIGAVSHEAVPLMKTGATLIVLDAAAPAAGQLAQRDDLSFVACHPCHPSVFNRDERDAAAQWDYFGGMAGRQDVVLTLLSGTESDYARAEGVVRDFFAPVVNAHRITLYDMVLLEPVLSETVAATCITVIEEAMREAIDRGVPRDAARAFILGHVGVELAILFGEVDAKFSDGAVKAVEAAKSSIFRDDWRKVFEPDAIAASIADIVR